MLYRVAHVQINTLWNLNQTNVWSTSKAIFRTPFGVTNMRTRGPLRALANWVQSWITIAANRQSVFKSLLRTQIKGIQHMDVKWCSRNKQTTRFHFPAENKRNCPDITIGLSERKTKQKRARKVSNLWSHYL